MDDVKSMEKPTLCYCSKCEQYHIYRIWYTGRQEIPTKFCYICKNALRKSESGLIGENNA